MPIPGVIASSISGHLQTGNFYLIQQLSPSAVSTISFNSIPSTYKSLQVRFNLVMSIVTTLRLQFNGDTSTSDYAMHNLNGTGSATSASGFATGTRGYVQLFTNGTTTTYPSVGIIDILDYANGNKNATVKAFNGANNNTSAGTIEIASGVWLSTSAINSLTLLSGSGTYTGTISLYGVS